MKKNILLLLSVSLLLIACGKNEKKTQLLTGISSADLSPKGTISCYSGKVTSSQVIPLNRTIKFADGLSKDYYLYIKSIEISQTGEEWVKIVDGTIEVSVKDGETTRIAASASVPVGQYDGVRLTIEPKVKFSSLTKWGNPDQNIIVELNKLPSRLGIMTGGSSNKITTSDTILFSSANGYLVPFSVEIGKETFLVIDSETLFIGDPANVTDWELSLACRGTRFLY